MTPGPARRHERRSYQQFCPVARALDVLGERWTLLIVRDLLTGPQRYRDLREHLPGMWSNLLATRLRDLEAAGIVTRAVAPSPPTRTMYELTERGRELAPVVHELARFGLPYLDLPTDDQPALPHLLTEGLRALVLLEALPTRGLTVGLSLDEGDFTMRVEPPGPGPLVDRVMVSRGPPVRADVTVRASMPVLVWLRRHDLSYEDAVATDLVEVTGSHSARARFRALLGV